MSRHPCMFYVCEPTTGCRCWTELSDVGRRNFVAFRELLNSSLVFFTWTIFTEFKSLFICLLTIEIILWYAQVAYHDRQLNLHLFRHESAFSSDTVLRFSLSCRYFHLHLFFLGVMKEVEKLINENMELSATKWADKSLFIFVFFQPLSILFLLTC